MDRKRHLQWKRFEKLAADPDKIPFPVRAHFVEIKAFSDVLTSYKELLSGLKTFSPVVTHIHEIRQGLEEGVQWLLDFIDQKIDFSDLIRDLRMDTADGLESQLDNWPMIFPRLPANISPEMERVTSDIEDLVERLNSKCRDSGYRLYHVLIGAA